jgi:putative acetyltransferase
VQVVVRPYRGADAACLSEVMWRSVREGALGDYSPEQCAAWLPTAPGTARMAAWSADGRKVFVAEDGAGAVVGYIDLEVDGHIDHCYCVPEAIRQGVAARLYDALEAEARTRGLGELHVEASEGARRFFAARGFALGERREWELRGLRIHHYAMTKVLGEADRRDAASLLDADPPG